MIGQELPPYVPSGKVDASLVWKLPAVLILVIFLAIGYSLLSASWSIVYLSFLLFCGLLMISGLLSQWFVIWAKVRNPNLGLFFGLLFGFAGVYVSWGVLIPELASARSAKISAQILLADPLLIVELIMQINREGWFSILDESIYGTQLTIIWGVEAVSLIAYPAYCGYVNTQKQMFCENCRIWAEEQPGVVGFFHPDEQELKRRFIAGDFEFMDQAEAIFNVPIKDYFQIDSDVCTGCNDNFTLTLRLMKKASDLDKVKPQVIHDKLIVKRAYFQHFLMLGGQFPAPEAD